MMTVTVLACSITRALTNMASDTPTFIDASNCVLGQIGFVSWSLHTFLNDCSSIIQLLQPNSLATVPYSFPIADHRDSKQFRRPTMFRMTVMVISRTGDLLCLIFWVLSGCRTSHRLSIRRCYWSLSSSLQVVCIAHSARYVNHWLQWWRRYLFSASII